MEPDVTPIADRFWSKVDKRGADQCWAWKAFIHPDGYGMFIKPRALNEKRTWRAHRFAWVLENGPIPDGLLVCHRCDNPKCCNPAHLFLGTDADNARDRSAKGRGADIRGERHPRAKLNCQQVLEIRAAASLNRIPDREMAVRYGVSRGVVNRIINRKTWVHI